MPPVSWNQPQFLNLIEFLAYDELQAGARISNVYFAVSCENVKSGPQALGVVFSRDGTYNDEGVRLETNVQVDAQAGFVDLAVYGYRPAGRVIAYMTDLDKKIPAEQVLALAEQAGGAERRASLSNNCIVRGSLLDNRWSIRYTSLEMENKEFAIFLDATTGGVLTR